MAGKASVKSSTVRKPTLLAGGNPQIAKADGDEAVQAYIAAMPGWKRDVGRRIDAVIVRTVPGVRKAVKWNSPFYGVPPSAWTRRVDEDAARTVRTDGADTISAPNTNFGMNKIGCWSEQDRVPE
jgi:hypothetical protein